MKKRSVLQLFQSLPPIFLSLVSLHLFAAGVIRTDGTVGTTNQTLGRPQMLTGTNVTIPQTMGTTVGRNLFHSFSSFNVNRGQTVTFAGDNGLRNVVSRVTGRESSTINGTLRSTIGKADVYLINPNGVTFGKHAQVDVPAGFHASTAGEIRFDDGSRYSASQSTSSRLTEASPAAFGFFAASKATNSFLRVNGANITTKPGKTLDLVGSDIGINKATLEAPSGQIRLIATQGAAEVPLKPKHGPNLPFPKTSSSSQDGGNIRLNKSTLTTKGNASGRISLLAGRLEMTNQSAIDVSNTGATNALPANGIRIRTTTLHMSNGPAIASAADGAGRAAPIHVDVANEAIIENESTVVGDTNGTGVGANIHLKAGRLRIDGVSTGKLTGIYSDANEGTGRAGDVTVEVPGLIQLLRRGQISSSTWSNGKAGTVTVNAGALNIDHSLAADANQAGVYSKAVQGSGAAGTVNVHVDDSIEIINGGQISTSTQTAGNAGQVNVSTGRLIMTRNDEPDNRIANGILSNTVGSFGAKAGSVNVNVRGELQILDHSVITTSTVGSSNAGSINVTAGSLRIDGRKILDLSSLGYDSGIVANSPPISSGNAGSVNVQVFGPILLVNGGRISSDSNSSGGGGQVSVNADQLQILGTGSGDTGIVAEVNAYLTGRPANIDVNVSGLTVITYGGRISTSTLSSRDAGHVTVNTGQLRIEGQGAQLVDTGILSNTTSPEGLAGNAGTVTVNVTGTAELVSGGEISSSTSSRGTAGPVQVHVKQLIIDGADSGIGSAAQDQSSGQTDNVTVNVDDNLHLLHNGRISTENHATVHERNAIKPGKLQISASEIGLDNAEITSTSTGNVAAGNIDIKFQKALRLDRSFITTQSHDGDGGAITLNGSNGLIVLDRSRVSTSVNGANGNGGDIRVNSKLLALNTGYIQAGTLAPAQGGDIKIAVDSLLPSANALTVGGSVPVAFQPDFVAANVIQAPAPTGISGNVQVTAPQLNLSGVLANLGNPPFDTNAVRQDYCSLGYGSSLTRRGVGGLLPPYQDTIGF